MAAGPARDVVAVRAFPAARIAVGGAEEHQDFLAFADPVAADLDLDGAMATAAQVPGQVTALHVDVAGRPVVRDALRLTAGIRPVRARLADSAALITLVIGGPGFSGLCAQVLAAVAAQPLERQPRLTASALGTWGVLLRGAAVEREALDRTVRSLLQGVCPRLGDDPWQRRP